MLQIIGWHGCTVWDFEFVNIYIYSRPEYILHAVEMLSPYYNKFYNNILLLIHIHWASKETYNFLEWCPQKSPASKWMIFGLMLATVLLITHVKNTEIECAKN